MKEFKKNFYRAFLLLGSGSKAVARTDLTTRALLTLFFRTLFDRKKTDGQSEFFLQLVSQNFRLSPKLKLGRPSPSIFKKIYEDFLVSKIYSQPNSVSERKSVKYLLIRDGAMGDVLMMTPVLRELHDIHSGDVSIDVATNFEFVFSNNPYVTRVFDLKTLRKGVRSYDVVVDLNGVYERAPNKHPVDAYAKCVFGGGEINKQLEIYSSQSDEEMINKVVKDIGSPYIVVHYFSHEWPNREVSSEIWQRLLRHVAIQSSYTIIFIGVARDQVLITNDRCEDHRGRYSIQQLKLLIDRSIGFLGGDSGPSHVAAATNAPMAVFYTCAHHEARMPLRNGGKFMPLMPNVDCYGCLTRNPIPRPGYYCERGDNACTSGFDVEKIKLQIINFFEIQT
jgi:heptosyltransferase III